MKKKICFAGFAKDELESLKQALARISGTWDCEFAVDGPAAFTTLSRGTFDAVVANMDLEGMNGAELLQKIGEQYPKTLRFIVSDVENQESVINCIGGTHQFIARPFKPQDLVSTIQRSFALDAWLSTDALRTLVQKLHRLPSLPSTYFEVLKQVESPHASVTDIGQVIARDPSATARLLQMVNSAALALAQKITDPVEAVGLLGVETVKSLALCLQVFSQSDEAKQSGVSLEKLWNHSFTVAKTASKLTFIQTRDIALANQAFTAGLLHDVGRIVIASNMPKEYGAIVAAAKKDSRPLHEEEKAQLGGVSHAQVGGYLLGLWGMPAALVEAAALHHEPSQSSWGDFSVLTAVHVANVFVHEQEGAKDGLPKPQLDLEHLRAIGLEKKPDAWRKALSGDMRDVTKGDTQRITQPETRSTKPRPAAAPTRGIKPVSSNSNTGYWVRKMFVPVTATFIFVSVGLWLAGFGESVPVKARSREDIQAAVPAVAPQAAPVQAAAPVAKVEETPAEPAAPATGFDSIRLQGVFYTAAHPSAIINGKTVGLGQRINGLTVVAIQMGSVTLSSGTEQKIFKVK